MNSVTIDQSSMNYRHIYHAGNFADVFKHLILTGLIDFLSKKEKSFFYLDTHAGIGNYHLISELTQKKQEYKNGIFKVWKQELASLPILKRYFQTVKNWNLSQGSQDLEFYPGSPCLVKNLIRNQDRMVLTELHGQDFEILKDLFHGDRQVSVHHLDGYLALKAFLPPKERRGLVFIDPPFEERNEYGKLFLNLRKIIHLWPTGIYAIWYPIKNLQQINHFYQQWKSSGIRKILCIELHLSEISSSALSACGMIVINPPWQFAETIKSEIQDLTKLLAVPESRSLENRYVIKWVVPE